MRRKERKKERERDRLRWLIRARNRTNERGLAKIDIKEEDSEYTMHLSLALLTPYSFGGNLNPGTDTVAVTKRPVPLNMVTFSGILFF